MISRKEIEELLRYRKESGSVVSAYINVTPPRDFAADVKSIVEKTRRDLESEGVMDKEGLRSVEQVFHRIEGHTREALQRLDGVRLVVVFADNGTMWKEYHLPLSIPTQIVVDQSPCIRPLSMLLDQFARYCVLVSDARKARIFSLYLGECEEYPDIFIEDNVPDRVNTKISRTAYGAGRVHGGLGDSRIQRHVEEHIHRHLKHVAEKTFSLFKKEDFDLLILGGPDNRELPLLREHLHSYLKQKIAGQCHVKPDSSTDVITEKALEVARQWEHTHEERLINTLFEKSAPGGTALLGVQPVLEALSMGKVHTLVIDHEFGAEGSVCAKDHVISTCLDTCPVCGEGMHRTDALGEEMIDEAIAQGAEVEHIFGKRADFQTHGVGALLRFAG